MCLYLLTQRAVRDGRPNAEMAKLVNVRIRGVMLEVVGSAGEQLIARCRFESCSLLKQRTMEQDYNWVLKVIHSCDNTWQIATCERLVESYQSKYNDAEGALKLRGAIDAKLLTLAKGVICV